MIRPVDKRSSRGFNLDGVEGEVERSSTGRTAYGVWCTFGVLSSSDRGGGGGSELNGQWPINLSHLDRLAHVGCLHHDIPNLWGWIISKQGFEDPIAFAVQVRDVNADPRNEGHTFWVIIVLGAGEYFSSIRFGNTGQ